jgi:hypothetical protein
VIKNSSDLKTLEMRLTRLRPAVTSFLCVPPSIRVPPSILVMVVQSVGCWSWTVWGWVNLTHLGGSWRCEWVVVVAVALKHLYEINVIVSINRKQNKNKTKNLL